ncbi:MAG TPA: alpha/beta hydrolase [Caulobacteraceae bacterium]|jgi:alpha-beta hydrolase superfamily lysophospholipase
MRRPLALAFAVALTAGALGACAPTLQQAERPAAAFTGPRLEKDVFVSFDGARLGLTRWDALGGPPKAVIIGVHGMDDYANAFHLAAADWARRGITTLAFDQRGFGRSPGRGVWAPDALSIEDLRTLVVLARQTYPGAIIAVAGESLGGAIAIEAFASDRPPAADRLILLAPAVWGWSRQPLTYTSALWIADHLAPGWVITPPRWLTSKINPTDNEAELIAMSRDPLMEWGARTDALYGLVGTMQSAWRETGALKVPTLYLYGAHDEIIPKRPSFEAAARLPRGDRTAYYAAGWHLLLRDLQAKNVWADSAAFVFDPAAPLPSGAPPIPPPAAAAAEEKRAAGVVSGPAGS